MSGDTNLNLIIYSLDFAMNSIKRIANHHRKLECCVRKKKGKVNRNDKFCKNQSCELWLRISNKNGLALVKAIGQQFFMTESWIDC